MNPDYLMLDALNNNLDLDARQMTPFICGDINQQLWLGIKNLHNEDPVVSKSISRPGCYYFAHTSGAVEQSIRDLPNHSFAVILGYESSIRKLQKDSSASLLSTSSMHTLFFEPMGKLSHLHNYPNVVNALLKKIGVYVPNTTYSPYYLLILQKDTTRDAKAYESKLSFKNRVSRIYERLTYKLLKKPRDAVALFSRSVLPISERAYRSVQRLLVVPTETNRVRIAFATGQLAPGGVETVLLNIISSLPRSKYHITLYTTAWNSNLWKPRFEEICDDIIEIPQLFGHNFPEKYTSRLFIDNILRLHPEILFITNSSIAYTSLPFIHNDNLKVVDLLHTYGTPQEKDAFLGVSAPYEKYIAKRVVISYFLKNYLLKNYGVNKDSVTVIYNGISPKNVSTRSEALATLGIPARTRLISFVGRLQPDKSPERLIYIAEKCKSLLTKESAVILIVGAGELQDSLTMKAADLGLSNVIKFIGYHPDPLAILKQSSFSILTSNLEGIPMSIIESLMVGTPPISTSVGGVPEMYDNSCGYLVVNDEHVVDNFCAAIKSGLSMQKESYEKMRLNCTDRYGQQFSHMSQDYLSLFESMLK